ncbi:hypothetical protein Droror1_Dr00022996 [Drosera rotundifolia]
MVLDSSTFNLLFYPQQPLIPTFISPTHSPSLICLAISSIFVVFSFLSCFRIPSILLLSPNSRLLSTLSPLSIPNRYHHLSIHRFLIVDSPNLGCWPSESTASGVADVSVREEIDEELCGEAVEFRRDEENLLQQKDK